MFSSVVAAVLVMASVVLVTTLISTEEKTNSQVYTMINSFELSDAASLARADALQSFNYNFREKMEDFLSCQCPACVCSGGVDEAKYFPILNMDNYEDWDDMEKAFERVILLSDENTINFERTIKFVADRTVSQFDNRPYGKYNVYLSDTGQNAKDALREGLNQVLIDAANEDERFVEIVECDGDADYCPLGTFYFNIPLNKLENYPELYEKLPRIVIRDTISGGEMKIAILPKSNLRIYIPLRFFKAIYEARKQAKAIADAEEDLKDSRLGFCDEGCIPRTDPLDSAGDGAWNKECPTGASSTQSLTRTGLIGIDNYIPGGSQGPLLGLLAVAKSLICDATISANVGNVAENGFGNYNFAQGGLKPREPQESLIPRCPYQKIDVIAKSYETKTVEGHVTPLYCMQILGTQSQVIYEEVNPLYIVSGAKNFYKIQISTTHEPVIPGNKKICSNGTGISTCAPK